MIKINPHYAKLQSSYLFVEIQRRIDAFRQEHPSATLITLGIGDVTNPLTPSIVAAFAAGVEEQGGADSFRGYGPEQGYPFLREAIAAHDFALRGCPIAADDVFVSDGAKCDTGNFQELFATDITVGVADPVYPVYVDTNVMAGRTGRRSGGTYERLVYLPATRENGYVPPPPEEPMDLIYLCYPNNPAGSVATHAGLAAWVEYAHHHGALILFDAAYEAFIRDPDLPHSIYEVDGADQVAVEFRSFSKTAGFTGTRCAYTVVPRAITLPDGSGGTVRLHDLWNRRQSTKFNGVSYPVQRAAAAVYSPEGQAETRALADGYLANARKIRDTFVEAGYEVSGGLNSPYVWIASGGDSWEFFDTLLRKAHVVVTPGVGFGPHGEGYIRISGFNSANAVDQALERIRAHGI